VAGARASSPMSRPRTRCGWLTRQARDLSRVLTCPRTRLHPGPGPHRLHPVRPPFPLQLCADRHSQCCGWRPAGRLDDQGSLSARARDRPRRTRARHLPARRGALPPRSTLPSPVLSLTRNFLLLADNSSNCRPFPRLFCARRPSRLYRMSTRLYPGCDRKGRRRTEGARDCGGAHASLLRRSGEAVEAGAGRGHGRSTPASAATAETTGRPTKVALPPSRAERA